jgi:hypothetical protein
MSLGSSIVDSIAAVGSTVHTLDKIKDAQYVEIIAVGGIDVPLKLDLRTASLGSNRQRFGASWKFNPATNDVPSSLTLGRISISLNVDASLGSNMTPTEVANHVRWFFGAMLKATLIETLQAGSVQ